METGVTIRANKKAKQNHESVFLSQDDCYLVEGGHFCFAMLHCVASLKSTGACYTAFTLFHHWHKGLTDII